MQYAKTQEKNVTIVLPTQKYLSQNTDTNGDRCAKIDENTLRSFIKATLDGTYGSPTIQAFEIENKYWRSGEMSSTEYGRVSSRMAEIVDDELTRHSGAESTFGQTDIVVQMGENYNYARLNEKYETHTSVDDKIAALNQDYSLDLDHSILTPGGHLMASSGQPINYKRI
jgi:Tfp pilus assembly protein PilX